MTTAAAGGSAREARAWHPLLVALFVLVWLVAATWTRRLMLPDEGRYVGVAWEMLRSGNWLFPTLDGLPYFHKPPLFYWITAASLSVFGPLEAAARLAPVLGAWIGALGLYAFMLRWSSRQAAQVTLAALVVQPFFLLGGQYANLDMLVAGFIALTILLLADAVFRLEGGLAHRRSLVGAAAAAGLGVLAKGLIGLVIPVLVVGIWLLATGRWRLAPRMCPAIAVAAFLVVAAPWFVAMQLRFPDFLDYFFIEQHFRRFASGGFNNVQPFWFYPAILALGCLPILPWVIRSLRRPGRGPDHQASMRVLMLVWVAVVVVFFSLPQSKLIGYILPAVMPMAALAADGLLNGIRPAAASRRRWGIALGVCAAVSLSAIVAFAVHPKRSSRDVAQALASQRAAGEPILMLENYFFDLPFYARLREPVGVVEAWTADHVLQRDDWRKELADAARFDATAGTARLIHTHDFLQTLCGSPVTWVVTSRVSAARFPELSDRLLKFESAEVGLWRVERAPSIADHSLICDAAPNGPDRDAPRPDS